MRTERVCVGLSEPYLADVSFATYRASTGAYVFIDLGTKDEGKRVFRGSLIADSLYEDVAIAVV